MNKMKYVGYFLWPEGKLINLSGCPYVRMSICQNARMSECPDSWDSQRNRVVQICEITESCRLTQSSVLKPKISYSLVADKSISPPTRPTAIHVLLVLTANKLAHLWELVVSTGRVESSDCIHHLKALVFFASSATSARKAGRLAANCTPTRLSSSR